MSLHSSLKIDPAGAQQRTVLTRIERIKELMKKGLWLEGQRVNALPKTKIVRIKSKAKAKAEKVEGAEGTTAAAGAAATAKETGAAKAAPAGKAAAASKAPAAKPAK